MISALALTYLFSALPSFPPFLILPDPAARAKAFMMAEVVSSGIQPIQNLSVLKHIEELAGAEARAAWGTFLSICTKLFLYLCFFFLALYHATLLYL